MHYLAGKLTLVLSIFVLGHLAVMGQNLVTSHQLSPKQLVEDILVKGACLSVENVQPIGNSLGIGHYLFQGTAPIFREGIILSTGDIVDAKGPNFSTNISGELGGYTTDPDLDLFASDSLFDVTGLEFDFVPFDSVVEFRFLFASEEYCEFVGSEFNDVFGFFVSGPGLDGPFSNNAVNVALIPGTEDYVTINSVNHLVNNNYYIPNETRNDAAHCRKLYQPSFLEETEYDGLTTPIKARFKVIPCATYHIRLVVADVADPLLDSGVFLEARSFNLGGEVTVRAVVAGKDSLSVNEGCENAYFLFERVDKTNHSSDLTFKVSTAVSSTAESDVDYGAFPDSLTIPAFQDSILLPVETFLDNESEPPESIFLELELSCKCSAIQAELNLLNTTPLAIDPVEEEACLNVPSEIFVAPSGGVAPYSYSWSNSEQTESISVTINSTTSYRVTVADACGQQDSTNVQVVPVDPPSGILAGDIRICDVREDYSLPVELFGNGPWDIQLNINGRDTTIYGIDEVSYRLPVTETGQYLLIAVTNRICTVVGAGSSVVEKDPLELQVLDCSETDSKAYEFSFTGTGRAEFSVDSGLNFLPLEELVDLNVNKPHRILIRDEAGCTDWQTVFLPTPVGYQINIPALNLKLNQEGEFQPRFNFPHEFIRDVSWSPATGLSCSDCLNPTVTGLESGRYRLDIEDKFGCIHTGFAELTVDFTPFFLPDAFSPHNQDGINDLLDIFIDQTTVLGIESFEIFDRWGNHVFGRYQFMPGADTGWDGQSRGKPMNPGVYVYKMTLELRDGRIKTYVGDVTLVN